RRDRVLASPRGVLRDERDGVLGKWRQLELRALPAFQARAGEARLAVVAAVPELLAVEVEEHRRALRRADPREALAGIARFEHAVRRRHRHGLRIVGMH